VVAGTVQHPDRAYRLLPGVYELPRQLAHRLWANLTVRPNKRLNLLTAC
jgi:hypothetical protein